MRSSITSQDSRSSPFYKLSLHSQLFDTHSFLLTIKTEKTPKQKQNKSSQIAGNLVILESPLPRLLRIITRPLLPWAVGDKPLHITTVSPYKLPKPKGLKGSTYHQIPQQHRNSNLANARHINTRLLLHRRPVKVPEAAKVDADHAFSQQLGRHLELFSRDATNNYIRQRQDVVESEVGLVDDLVAQRLDAGPAGEELDAGDVDRVDCRAVVGQQGGEGAAVDFAAVDYRNCLSVEAVSIGEDGVVDLEVFQRFDNRQWGAREDGLFEIGRGVEEANVVVHVEEVGVAETFNILGEGDSLLDVAVLMALVGGPDGVVDEDTVDFGVVVGGDDGLLEGLLVYLYQVEREALFFAGLFGPFGVLVGVGVVIGEEGGQGWAARELDGREGGLDFGEHLFGDGVGEDHFAGFGGFGRGPLGDGGLGGSHDRVKVR